MSTEAAVSRGVQQFLVLLGGRCWSNEVGALGSWREGAFVGRRGGTRATPGWPDLAALMPRPLRFTLTVEVKGARTAVRPAQWEYAKAAMDNGQPHLIVRSTEALYWGLHYLGLLAPRFVAAPPFAAGWETQPPVNVAFLEDTRSAYWEQVAPALRPPPPLLLPQSFLTSRTKRPADV